MSLAVVSYGDILHQQTFSLADIERAKTRLSKMSRLQQAFLSIALEKHCPQFSWYDFWSNRQIKILTESVLNSLELTQYSPPKAVPSLEKKLSELIQIIPTANKGDLLSILELLGEQNFDDFSDNERMDLADSLISRSLQSQREEITFTSLYLLRRIRKDSGGLGSIVLDRKLIAIFQEFVFASAHNYSRHLAYEGLKDLGCSKRIEQFKVGGKVVLTAIPGLIPGLLQVIAMFARRGAQQKEEVA